MAAQTLLELVQAFTAERGLPVPVYVVSNPDRQIMQILALLKAFNRDLLTRKAFQQNTVETTWQSLASEDQGDIDLIAPSGFEGILLDTFWDRTLRLPMAGGVTSSEWQARVALNFTGPLYQFRIWQNHLWSVPAPVADHTWAFEYLSSWFVRSEANDLKKFWTADTDTSIMGDELPLAYLAWAWPQAKGFEYAEAFAQYERLISVKLGRSNAPQKADLAGSFQPLRPGIVVSPGSWPLTNP